MKVFVFACAVSAALLGCGGTISTGSGSGSGGAGGHASTTGMGGATSTGAAMTSTSSSGSASSSSGSTGGCTTDADCGPLLQCCGGVCGNGQNDILNCGSCGNKCTGLDPFCAAGTCGKAPCTTPQMCGLSGLCCGMACCEAGQLCCDVPGPGPTMGAKCTDPVNGTCPVGCPTCD